MKAPARSHPERVYSFAPLIGAEARILILGSMPGVASLTARQYYAHPRNQFWHIMGELYGAGFELPYSERLLKLTAHGLALWDVLHSCVRPGSLDASIEHDTAAPNDLIGLLREHGRVVRLCCNGGAAFAGLRRHFGAQLSQQFPHVELFRLPSTSPANAGWSAQRKLEAWRRALRIV